MGAALVNASIDGSLFLQVLTGAVGLWGLTVDLPPEHAVVRSILLVETAVQFLELIVYACLLRGAPLRDMARLRYYDWFLTTPAMLTTIAAYMEYARRRSDQTDRADRRADMTLRGFLADNAQALAVVYASNAAMHAFGYLGEVGMLSRWAAFYLGFAAFALAFGVLWHEFARFTETGRRVFAFVATTWSLYGLAYMLPEVPKNAAFNALDLVAKNFFGLYLTYVAASLGQGR